MFEVTFSVVPPGGGEQDYMFMTRLPALPNAGDYIRVRVQDLSRTNDFIVRRRWFYASQPFEPESEDDALPVTHDAIVVEVEPALSGTSSPSHKSMCEMYAKREKPPQHLQASTY